MRRMRWAMCLWPGLAQLWKGGSWSGLAVAACAAALLNLALLATFVWTELVAETVRSALWVLLGAGWVICAVFTARWNRRQRQLEEPDATKDTFNEAIHHYLKGNWFETERVLGNLLRHNPRDVDARLMLATLLRHAGRHSEAEEQLGLLTRLAGAEKWELEIRRERELLARARTINKMQVEEHPDRGAADPPNEMADAA